MAGGKALTDRKFIVDTFSKGLIFNLGHGIGQFTPIKHVEQLVSAVRAVVFLR